MTDVAFVLTQYKVLQSSQLAHQKLFSKEDYEDVSVFHSCVGCEIGRLP